MMWKEYPIAEFVGKCQTWNPKHGGAGGFDYIDLSSVDKDTKSIASIERYECSDAPSRARQLVETDDVLVATVRPSLNGVALINATHHGMTASTGYCVLRPDQDKLDPRFLFHWVKTGLFVRRMVDVATGANYPAVSDAKVKASKIPLPPVIEQKRIAGILDAADALRAKRREALAQLDTLLQSTFLDMFGDPITNPMGWPEVALGAHTSKIGSGATPLGGEAAYKKDGIALIRSMNVRDGHFSQHGLAFINDQQAARLDGVVVAPDDVLLNITGASVARVCRAPSDVLPSRVNQHVAIIRPTDSFDQKFLEQCLLFPSMKRRLLDIARAGATREAITKDAIKRLTAIQPPRNEQDRFAAIVSSVEQQKTSPRTHLAELDTLFASLQSRAFRGDI